MVNVQLIRADGNARIQGQAPDWIFEEAQAAFERAANKFGEPHEIHLSIAGADIRLRFAGDGLLDSTLPALEHLYSAPSPNPDLTISLWDTETSGVSLPPPLLQGGALDMGPDESPRVAHILDGDENAGLCWVSERAHIPYYERAAPLRPLLYWWFQSRKLQIAHAAAVGSDRIAVLLVGASGAGKSTTSLACIDAGLSYLGDDNCLITFEGEPRVFSLYNTIKLNWDNISRFPELPKPLENFTGVQMEKALFFMQQYRPQAVTRELPLAAILLPKTTGRQQTSIAPLSRVEALKILAPSTLIQMRGANQRAFASLTALTQSLPAYSLELGTELAGVTTTIKEFLTEL